MQYLIRPFLTSREKQVQDGLKYQIRSVDREKEARGLQKAFVTDKKYNPLLGLLVYISNDSRDSNLVSMIDEQLDEYKKDYQRIMKSRSEIRKLTEQMKDQDFQE